MEPYDYQIDYANIDFRHQYGQYMYNVSAAAVHNAVHKSLLVKRP